MGDLQDFASQICESIGKNTGRIAAVSDRDSIIALSGAPRRELVDRRNSADLENLMEQRKSYRYSPGNVKLLSLIHIFPPPAMPTGRCASFTTPPPSAGSAAGSVWFPSTWMTWWTM